MLLIFCQSSTALIHGVEHDAIKVSTVKIRFQHEHYLRSLGKWQKYESLCSAVAVGVKPLTLLTAAHCLKEIKLAETSGLPLIENEDTLVAINRLNKKNRYATELAIATIGDSGGAWLKKVGQGYELVAITSLVERFYNKSPHWNFFDKETPLLDYPYIAYGLRLGHPRVKNFLLYARNSGADITLD